MSTETFQICLKNFATDEAINTDNWLRQSPGVPKLPQIPQC